MGMMSENTEILKQIVKCDSEKPYIFISYSSCDATVVWRDVLEFQKRGYNIWIDEKNLNKEEESWRDDALKAINDYDCHLVVFYVSKTSLISGPCLNELRETKSEDTKLYHLEKPVNFIAIDVEDDIGNIIDFQKRVFTDITRGSEDKSIKKEKINNLANFIKEFFNNNNEKVRLEPNKKGRKADYYEEICAVFEKVGVVSNLEIVEASTSNDEVIVEEQNGAETMTVANIVSDSIHKTNNQRVITSSADLTVVEAETKTVQDFTPQPSGPIYYIKGAKYEAYLTKEENKYIVLKGSKIAENWKDWAGAKNIALHERNVDSNCIMLEDAVFSSVSAAVKFVKGTSTDGSGVFEEKNLVTEIKPISAEARVGNKEEDGSDAKKKSASVTGDIKYTLYGIEYEDNQSDMMLRVFAQVLKRHQDKVATLPEQDGMTCAIKYENINNPNESNARPVYFRTCANFKFDNGESVCIGTSYSIGDKMKKIARLFEICEEDRDVFYSEQVELPEITRSRGSSKGVGYKIYGQSYSGDQTDMMTHICSEIIARHPEKLQELVDGTLCIGYNDDVAKGKTYFRVNRLFTCEGKEYLVGTSFGLPAKVKEIEKVINICDEDIKNVQIEGFELESAPAKIRGKAKKGEDFLN